MKRIEALIGQSFSKELADSGLRDWICWDNDGVIYDDTQLTKEQITTLRSVVAGHDPKKQLIAPTQNEISRRQFFQQLAVQDDITEDEALAAVQSGAIPSALQGVVAALPSDQQFNAKMLLAGATTFKFSNPLTMALAAALSPPRTADQMKALWTEASALV